MSLGRVANIAANASPTDAQKYVAYKYLGASMVVDANHPAVPTLLKLLAGSNREARYGACEALGCLGKSGDTMSARINRHGVENERALRGRQ